jgi:hypothetical protein
VFIAKGPDYAIVVMGRAGWRCRKEGRAALVSRMAVANARIAAGWGALIPRGALLRVRRKLSNGRHWTILDLPTRKKNGEACELLDSRGDPVEPAALFVLLPIRSHFVRDGPGHHA